LHSDKDRIYSELLVVRYRRGDRDALEELIHYWEKKLFYYISRLVDNEEDAWDALQDTWVGLVRSICSLEKPRYFVVWLYRIARNSAMNKLRSRYVDRVFIEENEMIIKADEDAQEFSFEDASQVHLALERLSLQHREVLTLCFLEDLSVDEIAQILAVAPGTVKSRLHYAKRALKAIIEEEDNESAK